jgi:hypothetical protein
MQERTEIDILLRQFFEENPGFQLPPMRSMHPAVLIISSEIRKWLMQFYDCPEEFWEEVVECVKVWFHPGSEAQEYKILFSFMQSHFLAVANGNRRLEAAVENLNEWRQSVRRKG